MQQDVHEIQFQNGFRALLLERRALPVVASMIWYQVGSRDERPGETGLSHFLEHMMFKGTDRYAKGTIDLTTAKLGGNNNAFTDNDVTAYYFSLASDRWEAALEIEANRMHHCLLDPAEFEAEKSVVLEELAMGEDDPWRRVYHGLESLAYQVHPYHHPVIGWREDLERVGVDGMRAYYRRHYGPNRAFLVVVGDFATDATVRRIEELFGQLPASAEPRAPVLSEPPQQGERRAMLRAPGDVSRIALAVNTCTLGEEDDFVLDVISVLLGSGKTSRLYRRLVLDEEVASNLSVYNEVRREPGLFWISAELVGGARPERVEALIREEIAKLIQGPIKPAELARARMHLRSGFLFESETALDTATRLGRFESLGKQGWRLLQNVLDRYAQIGPQQVRGVAERWFREDGWNVVWSVPHGAKAAAAARPRPRKARPKRKPAGKRRATARRSR